MTCTLCAEVLRGHPNFLAGSYSHGAFSGSLILHGDAARPAAAETSAHWLHLDVDALASHRHGGGRRFCKGTPKNAPLPFSGERSGGGNNYRSWPAFLTPAHPSPSAACVACVRCLQGSSKTTRRTGLQPVRRRGTQASFPLPQVQIQRVVQSWVAVLVS